MQKIKILNIFLRAPSIRNLGVCHLIPDLKTPWSTKIPMLFLTSLDNLLYYKDVNIILYKSVDTFEIEHKTCYFFGQG